MLALLAFIVGKQSSYGCLMTGAMLTIPYLLSSITSMELERTTIGRKNVMGCIMVSAIISGIMIVLNYESEAIIDGAKIQVRSNNVLTGER